MERYIDLSPVERIRLRPAKHNGPSVAASFQRLIVCEGFPESAAWYPVTYATVPAEKVAEVTAAFVSVASEAVTRVGIAAKGEPEWTDEGKVVILVQPTEDGPRYLGAFDSWQDARAWIETEWAPFWPGKWGDNEEGEYGWLADELEEQVILVPLPLNAVFERVLEDLANWREAIADNAAAEETAERILYEKLKAKYGEA